MNSKRLLCALLALLTSCLMLEGVSVAAPAQEGPSLDQLLVEWGQVNQEIQFNPGAALQKRIFADDFVPNSGEFDVQVSGLIYRGQRAEHLGSGEVRVYYVAGQNWGQVQFVARSNPGPGSHHQALLNEAGARQRIQFNPGAAIQQRMFGDGFVPNSGEFDVVVAGSGYRGQRAEHLASGEVRIYYVRVGAWANVMIVNAGTHPPEPARTKVVVNGTGHVVGPLPVIYYALTSPNGLDVYPLGSGSYALWGLFDSGSDKVRISQRPPPGLQSDAGYLNLTQLATVNIRLNGLNTRQPNGNIPIGPPGSANSPQVELKNIVVKPVDVPVTLIGAPAVNRVVAYIDYRRIIVDPENQARGPYLEFYLPGDSRIPAADIKLALAPAGRPVSTDGATAGQRYWLRNVTLEHAGRVVSDRQQGLDFFFDTGTTMTIINGRVAGLLGLTQGAGNANCFKGTNNRYLIDGVTMRGLGGTYHIQHAVVCWDENSIEQGAAVIGSNFFDQVQLVLDGPGATVGIRSDGAGEEVTTIELAVLPTPAQTGCQGARVGGSCWYLGGRTESCDTVCASHSGYDEASRSYAGSAGSVANCRHVLQALGVVWSDFFETTQGGIGCFTMRSSGGTNVGFWDRAPTTAAASYNGRQRVCACRH